MTDEELDIKLKNLINEAGIKCVVKKLYLLYLSQDLANENEGIDRTLPPGLIKIN